MIDEQELFNRIDSKFVKFGSRGFDCEYDEDSDYDYIMSEESALKLMKYLDKTNIKYIDKGNILKESSGGYDYIPNNKLYNTHNLKMLINGKMVNIISYPEEEISIVYEIIDSIRTMLATNNNVSDLFKSNKEARIMIINGFFNAVFRNFKNEEDEIAF